MATHPTLFEESEALHARVRAFARSPGSPGDFEELALRIARFQVRYVPGFARLVAARGSALDSVASLPAVPTDAFRLTRVAVHPPEQDVVRFLSSGTTASERSLHALRSTRTYAELAPLFAREWLGADMGPLTVVALAAAPGPEPTSSLVFMMQLFMSAFDGRALEAGTSAFDVNGTNRWLLHDGAVDLGGLRAAVRAAERRREPLLLLSTSLALLLLLEALAGERLPLPPGSVVMQTGGYKGRSVEVSSRELRERVALSLELPESSIVSEYGMTELSSQLYEGTVRSASHAGVHFAPPWLRVSAVDPISLDPVPEGAIGLARFVDLANVDSAVAIVTADRIRARDGGIELLGRDASAPPRGCSLAVEALMQARVDASGRR